MTTNLLDKTRKLLNMLKGKYYKIKNFPYFKEKINELFYLFIFFSRIYRSMVTKGTIADKMENYFEIMQENLNSMQSTQRVILDGYIDIMGNLKIDNSRLIRHREKLSRPRGLSENFG